MLSGSQTHLMSNEQHKLIGNSKLRLSKHRVSVLTRKGVSHCVCVSYAHIHTHTRRHTEAVSKPLSFHFKCISLKFENSRVTVLLWPPPLASRLGLSGHMSNSDSPHPDHMTERQLDLVVVRPSKDVSGPSCRPSLRSFPSPP